MARSFLKSKYFHLLLFIVTLATTTIAGAEQMTGRSLFGDFESFSWPTILGGLLYSVPFLLILSAHEFGHYFAAKYHKIKATLPYYLPVYLGPILSIGTFGAIIRIKSMIYSRKVFFDIGIAGPLAGFVVALGVLFYGFTNLPPEEHIFSIHPEYKEYGLDYEKEVYSIDFYKKLYQEQIKAMEGSGLGEESELSFPTMALGENLIFAFFKRYVAPDPELVPNKFELMHYPLLLAGYLALFFTGLNLIPIGQLDGGHILYGLIGNKYHRYVSSTLFVGLVFYAGLDIITLKKIIADPFYSFFRDIPLYLGFLYLVFSKVTPEAKNNLLLAVAVFTVQFIVTYFNPDITGYSFWLVFCFLIGRVLGVYHPPTLYDEPLDTKRKILGWLSLIIFILCFTPEPFIFEIIK
ncbi:MAG TPA: site-2 protease family protein [Cytophagales bacterium]|nr:site-2 protease family protein [Cytophagales bacterium]